MHRHGSMCGSESITSTHGDGAAAPAGAGTGAGGGAIGNRSESTSKGKSKRMVASVDARQANTYVATMGSDHHISDALDVSQKSLGPRWSIHKLKSSLGEATHAFINSRVHYRRKIEPKDSKAIDDTAVVAKVWNNWCHTWLAEELTTEQETYRMSQKTSIFSAWIFKTYGCKYFVLGLIQTGLSWRYGDPSSSGASEHTELAELETKRYFTNWLKVLLHNISFHKNTANTQAARLRSGTTYQTSGLTPQQAEDRRQRDIARKNYHWALQLERQLNAAKAMESNVKGKQQLEGKGKGKEKKGVTEHIPKKWSEMNRNEQWYLKELWNGNLYRAMRDAENKHGGRVQADYFVLPTET